MTLDDETAARIAREIVGGGKATRVYPHSTDVALVRAGYAARDAEVEELRAQLGKVRFGHMSIDIERLRRLASAATPGPWVAGSPDMWDDIPQSALFAEGQPITWDDHSGEVFKPADAEFIAAANPQTILSLLDEVERLRSTLLRIHGYVQGAVRREVPTFEDQRGAEYDAALIESLADHLEQFHSGYGAGAILREKARERREGVS